jgi:membrane associated rhomboid family serine protease
MAAAYPSQDSSKAQTLQEEDHRGLRGALASVWARILGTPASFGLLLVTSLVFLIQLGLGQLSGCDTLLLAGAKDKAAIAAGEFWRLVTPLFLHTCMRHAGVNLLSLFALGPALERFYGGKRLLAVYVIAGVGGVMFSLLLCPAQCVGASGAVLGLVGALLAMMYRHRHVFGRQGILRLVAVSLVAFLSLGFGIAEDYDMWGHLGGLLTGFLLGFVLGPVFRKTPSDDGHVMLVDTRPWRAVRPRVLLSALVIFSLALAAAYFPTIA